MIAHACHVEQMLRVFARTRAAAQHEIVARLLALGAEMLGGAPHERMEPVERARRAAKGVAKEIVALHVRELVREQRAAAFVTPRLGGRGQHDRGRGGAAGERHLDAVAEHEARRLLEVEPVGDFAERHRPVGRRQLSRADDDAAHLNRADDHKSPSATPAQTWRRLVQVGRRGAQALGTGSAIVLL